ncbi:MAG: DUF4252 domain-containing protein [Bacteroidales bacterium]|nr:DUF4252 domain-containing protein [Bacteroidales bacterium]
MRKIVLLLLLTPWLAEGQQNPLDPLFEKYASRQDVFFFDLHTNMIDPEPERRPTSEVALRIIAVDSTTAAVSPEGILREFEKTIDRSQYKGLVEVRSGHENIDILARQQDDRIISFIVIAAEKNETLIMAASGSFLLEDILKLGEVRECRIFNALEKLCE